jgi:sortase B
MKEHELTGKAVIRMDRMRRSTKYDQPASEHPVSNRPPNSSVPPRASLPAKERNPNQYQTGGYRPPNAPGRKPVRKFSPHRKAATIAVMVTLFAVFVFASYQVIAYLIQSHQAKQEEQMIQALIAQSEATSLPDATAALSPAPTAAPAQAQAPAPTALSLVQSAYSAAARPEVLLQFNKALEINPDTVGQLEMGESINTYVVQRDNSYYLRRSFTGEYSFSGAIFMDVTCSIYPRSRNLIIHGHNMHNGTAFGKLSRFDDIDYLNKYPFIKFSTLYETARYTPFAVVYYSIDPDSDRYLNIYQINSMTDQEFLQFVSKVSAMSEYHMPVNVAKADKILTITTCASGDEEMRFAVFAVQSDVY